jgi:tetratricopeptide (TPR) repeat protein
LTTESLPALKSYLQAESQLRSGRFNAALESFQEAVAQDPDFALAWYRMSVAAEWASVGTDQVHHAASQAVRLSDRLSERYRRLLEARLATQRGDTAAAETRYRTIVGSHPDDVEAWAQLGEVLSHQAYSTGRSTSESREAWERVLELDPNSVGAMWHLARVAALEGETEELKSLANRILELSPEGDRALEIEALLAYATEDRQAQEAVLNGLREVSDTVVALSAWAIAISGDRPEAFAEIAEILTAPSRSRAVRAQGYSIMAYAELARGRWSAAKEYLDRLDATSEPLALEHRGLVLTMPIVPASESERRKLHQALSEWDASQVPPVGINSNFFDMHDSYHQQFRSYLMGALEALLGDERCLESAAELEALPGSQEEQETARDLAAGVRARWWRHQGDNDRALEELESLTFEGVDYQEAYGSPFLSFSPERFLRAEILLEQGRAEEALPLLNSFGETSYFEEVFVVPAHFRQGEAHENLDQPEEAIRNYQRVVDLWRDCQPPLCSWVEEAKASISRLSQTDG